MFAAGGLPFPTSYWDMQWITPGTVGGPQPPAAAAWPPRLGRPTVTDLHHPRPAALPGTALGDPIEVGAQRAVYGKGEDWQLQTGGWL